MEALDLAAGLGVIRPGVPRGDPERQELGLHGRLTAAEAGGEDGAVVGEEALRVAPAGGGTMQAPHDVG